MDTRMKLIMIKKQIEHVLSETENFTLSQMFHHSFLDDPIMKLIQIRSEMAVEDYLEQVERKTGKINLNEWPNE